MRTYFVNSGTASVDNEIDCRVILSLDQARRRRSRIYSINRGEGLYAPSQPLTFKAGEYFGCNQRHSVHGDVADITTFMDRAVINADRPPLIPRPGVFARMRRWFNGR